MKPYLDLLQDILDHGVDHTDRTGAGRRSIYGRMLRFDLSDQKLPLVTTRMLYPKSVIGELLWFISGSNNVKDLQALGVNFWNRWAVRVEDVDEFLRTAIQAEEELKQQIKPNYVDSYEGSIGPIYGPLWRNAPVMPDSGIVRERQLNEIPIDKMLQYQAEFIEQHADKEGIDIKEYVIYCNQRYNQSFDQLNELLIGLKERPYSSRHVVSCWVPDLIPLESLSPQMNVLLNKGALAPCHVMFQCLVKPPYHENEKPKLTLMITQRLY